MCQSRKTSETELPLTKEVRFNVTVPEVDVYLKNAGKGGSLGEVSEILCEVGSRFFKDEEVTMLWREKSDPNPNPNPNPNPIPDLENQSNHNPILRFNLKPESELNPETPKKLII